MRVRLIFYCPRCGSLLYRPSLTKTFRDNFLAPMGVHAHRCYMCRLRFYLFKPSRLRGFLSVLDRPLAGIREIEPRPMDPAVETGNRRRLVAGDLLRQNRL
ncbi:MAG: hypothetical protein LAP38_28590 [Acidobacteriia bacterium]|nr:hypothetical protein [Terriglobia bacterium]